MSLVVAVCSDMPLATLPNPHVKMYSVNEALENGIEVPKGMLMDYEIDHDEPGMIMWSDIEPDFDIEKGIFSLPDPDDNFDIWPLEEPEELPTTKSFMAAVEWSRCTVGRAEMLLGYIESHLACAGEVELWCARLGGSESVEKYEKTFAELSGEDVLSFCDDKMGLASAQKCLVIKK